MKYNSIKTTENTTKSARNRHIIIDKPPKISDLVARELPTVLLPQSVDGATSFNENPQDNREQGCQKR